jgi:hypothetical protein
MSWAAETKLRLQFFAIFLTVLCPALLVWQAAETRRQIASLSWPSVTGEVQGVRAKPWVDQDGHTKYYGRVVYHYLVEGKEYTTDLTDLGPGAKRASRDAALADVDPFRPGMSVTVYYDPADPGTGVIEKGIPTPHLVLLIGLGIGTIVGAVVGFFTVRGWVRGLRQKSDEGRLRPDAAEPVAVTTAPAQAASLGDRIEVFRPMRANIVAGFILSALLVGGGMAAIAIPLHAAYLAGWDLPFDVKKGWSWLAVGLFALLGIIATLGGVALAAYSRGLLSQCVEIHVNGFRYTSRQGAEDVLWRDISRVQETILYERPPLLKGPAKVLVPKLVSSSYTVVTTAGKEYGFDGNSIKAIKRFGGVLREQAQRLALPWEMVEAHVG